MKINEQEERVMECASMIHSLKGAGVSEEGLKKFLELFLCNDESQIEQIQILKKQRFSLLDEIHRKQQSLDKLDYIIFKIKNNEF